jgi:hypothetical protein
MAKAQEVRLTFHIALVDGPSGAFQAAATGRAGFAREGT